MNFTVKLFLFASVVFASQSFAGRPILQLTVNSVSDSVKKACNILLRRGHFEETAKLMAETIDRFKLKGGVKLELEYQPEMGRIPSLIHSDSWPIKVLPIDLQGGWIKPETGLGLYVIDEKKMFVAVALGSELYKEPIGKSGLEQYIDGNKARAALAKFFVYQNFEVSYENQIVGEREYSYLKFEITEKNWADRPAFYLKALEILAEQIKKDRNVKFRGKQVYFGYIDPKENAKAMEDPYLSIHSSDGVTYKRYNEYQQSKRNHFVF